MKIIPFLLLAMPLCAWSQIDIVEYRQSVADYSYTLKKSYVAIDYAENTYKAKQTNRLPSLTLSGNFTQQLRAAESQENWSFALQPQISQTIYSGGSVRAEVAKAELGVEIAQLDSQSDLLDIYYSADYAFYNLAATKSYRDAVAQYVEIITSLKDVVTLRYDEGYISKSDLLMIETRLSEALYEQIALNEDYTIALQKFNVLRGYSADTQVVQAAIDVDAVIVPYRSTLEELLLRRPDFLATVLAANQASYTVAITRSAYNPTVSVGIAGSWQPEMPNVNGSTIFDGSLFVRLSAPLFHFGERRKSVNASVALQQSSELSTYSLIDDIELEESNMWAKIVDSRAQLDAARKALKIGTENLEISTFSYSEGLTTILDVMQAQISWLQLYANSIWSEFNYLVSISAYKRISATGDL
ncbi:MAG: TolC family protein [Rikenellaceae bacterium]